MRKKILFNGLASSVGGVETFTLSFCEYLYSQNIEVGFLSFTKKMCFEKELLSMGAKIHRIKGDRKKNPISYKKEIKNFFKNCPYEIYYSNMISCSSTAPIIYAKQHGLRTIVHSHSQWKGRGAITKLLHFINKSKIKKIADFKFACSTEAGKWMFDEDEFDLIPNCIDVKKFKYDEKKREELRKKYNIEPETKVIGHVGSFSYIKNQEFLLKVFNNIAKNFNVMLMFIGEGEDRKKVEDLAKKMGLSQKVMFCGRVHNINEKLNILDVFVFPSIFEGLPIAVIEAQTNGLPVLISKEVSYESKIIDNCWFMSLEEGIDAWARKIEKIMILEREKTLEKIIAKGYDKDIAFGKLSKRIGLLNEL